MIADHDELVGFIRSTLGCGCPDEVLQTIRVERGGEGIRLDVGGRLLVRLVPAQGLDLARAVESGRGERDRRGFNRYRLVVITDEDAEVDRLRTEWQAVDVDDRLHLHTLEPEAIPAGLS